MVNFFLLFVHFFLYLFQIQVELAYILEQIWMLRMQEMTFPGFKFQKFSGGALPQTPPIHAWYIGHIRGFQPLLSPSNILTHRKVPFQKMPPHGKILKKGPDK
jgi:hypothetical protein